MPARFVTDLSKARMNSEQAWRHARDDNAWDDVADKLKAVIRLVREQAAALSDILGCPPYNALLDIYEPGLTR